jgi:hypothetical protein
MDPYHQGYGGVGMEQDHQNDLFKEAGCSFEVSHECFSQGQLCQLVHVRYDSPFDLRVQSFVCSYSYADYYSELEVAAKLSCSSWNEEMEYVVSEMAKN